MTFPTADSLMRALADALEGSNDLGLVAPGPAIDGASAPLLATPDSVEALARIILAAHDQGAAVAPAGGCTRTDLGNPIRRVDLAVSMRGLDGVVRHTPADMTATVQAGITLHALQQVVAKHGQFVPLDPPLPDRATLGGTLAVGMSGPLKWQYGNPRDVVLGMRVVHADGQVTRSGGQVVKNVSGFDLPRLHTGALGTLGIIAEVSLRLAPRPAKEATLIAAFPSRAPCLAAGVAVFQSAIVPLALTTLDAAALRCAAPSLPGPHLLAIRLGGRPMTLDRLLRETEGLCRSGGTSTAEVLDDATAASLWRGIADLGWGDGAGPAILARATLKPTALAAAAEALQAAGRPHDLELGIATHPAHGTLHAAWTALGTPPPAATASLVSRSRDALHGLGGTLVVERCPQGHKVGFDVWDAPAESLELMRRLKAHYDPQGTLNPGRFAGWI